MSAKRGAPAAEAATPSLSELIALARELDGNGEAKAGVPSGLRSGAQELVAQLESVLFPREHPWKGRADAASTTGRVELLGRIGWHTLHLIHSVPGHACPLAAGAAACPGLAAAAEAASALVRSLPAIRAMLIEDVESAYAGDPAAKSREEIIVTYPGFYAVMVYRLAHVLYRAGAPYLARVMTELAHSQTGIDIHPGAVIGRHFFIDHGTGVVIGETTVIGDHVTLYQGVTLGAVNFPRDSSGAVIRGQKRHPTIEDHVVIYSGATILGGEAVIGEGSIIGGNVWLTESVPPYSKVTAQPKVELKASRRKRNG